MICRSLTLLASLAISSYAFQLSPTRGAPSRVLVSRIPSYPRNEILFQKSPALMPTLLRQRATGDDSDAVDAEPSSSLVVEIIEPNASNVRDDDDAIAEFGSAIKRMVNARLAPFFLALAVMVLPLFLAFPADAVQSGGRMGGSFGGSNRQSSSRSYGSSGGGGYSRGYGRGYSSGYYSRPNVIVSPGPIYSPFYSPFSPFYARPSGVVVARGPSFGGLFFFAGFFLFAAAVLSNVGSIGDGGDSFARTQSVLGPGLSVAEISVALEVPDRDSPDSILSALDRLSATARTDSRVGVQNLTSQVAIELLRRKLSIVAASTRASHYRDENKAQREYNDISIRQRGKFRTEAVSKYGGVDYGGVRTRARSDPSEYSPKATVAVVTIVMMIDGDSTSKQLSSKVNSIRDVEDALSRIAADSKADDCLRGAEILWTPEDRDETLTMKDVFADYSSLRSV